MAISKKQVEHIAKLARLGLSEKEKEKYSKELSKILDYVEKLNEVNTSAVQPTSQVTGLVNVFRKDEKPDDIDPKMQKRLIGQAPESEKGFVKTKPILEKFS